METLSHFVPLWKILLVFAGMMAGIRLRLGVGLSILLGSMLMAGLFNMDVETWLNATVSAVTSSKTLYLAAIVGAILVLSNLLDVTDQNTRFLDAVSGYLRKPRVRLAFFPALIGLLPMPGGAVFSAPMVKTVSRDMNITDVDRVLINYWFRHIWEFFWPLYPGVILAASLADLPIATLAALGLPGCFFSLGVGWWFLLRPGVLTVHEEPNETTASASKKEALKSGLPLLTAICGSLALEGMLATLAPGSDYELGVIAALVAAVAVCMVQNRVPPARIASFLMRKHLWSMVFVIFAIFVFKDVLQGTGAISELARLAGGGAALVVAAVMLPFLSGMVGGIAIAFVGAAFPIILGMLEQLGMSGQTTPYVVLGMFSGMAGVVASPLHICFILTCEYFHVDIMRALKRVLLPCLIVLGLGVGYFFVLRSFYI